jgi:endonuclease/exonuclease/phosphatase family metal-dependent hydrolase
VKDIQTSVRQTKTYGILIIAILALCATPFVFVRAIDSDSSLLEIGCASKADGKRPTTDELRIVSYNMRWRGGDDLNALIKLLKDGREVGGASVIGLQEVDRKKERTNNTNTARKMAEDLGMHYAWAAPPPAEGKENVEEETGVAILSQFPLTDVTRILLPNEGPGGRRRVALGATMQIGENKLRVYSVHAEVRTSNAKRTEQLKAVLDDLQTHQVKVSHSIVLGDFNTLAPKDITATSRLFKEEGFETPFSNDEPTWRTFIIELKLDWLWLRGFDVKSYGIDKSIEMSDHWPLWIVVKMSDRKK